ncbi:hypothetical protein ACH3XW_49175 [Acanthocheilonema viteae]
MYQFTLEPISDTVARFCKNIKYEDKGIEIVYVYSTTGNRISGSTLVQHLLMRSNFRLRINNVEVLSLRDTTADVTTNGDEMQKFDDLTLAVASLYAIMNVEEYKTLRERILMKEYANVEAEVKSLIQEKFEIDAFCKKHEQRMLWLTLAAMGFQAGFLARLTWWKYDWDVVEPIIATYAALIASFSYHLYTYEYCNHSNHNRRELSLYFHKEAAKSNFDISRFNELQNVATSLKHDLKRLRYALYQHFPATIESVSLLEKVRRCNPSAPLKNEVDPT